MVPFVLDLGILLVHLYRFNSGLYLNELKDCISVFVSGASEKLHLIFSQIGAELRISLSH